MTGEQARYRREVHSILAAAPESPLTAALAAVPRAARRTSPRTRPTWRTPSNRPGVSPWTSSVTCTCPATSLRAGPSQNGSSARGPSTPVPRPARPRRPASPRQRPPGLGGSAEAYGSRENAAQAETGSRRATFTLQLRNAFGADLRARAISPRRFASTRNPGIARGHPRATSRRRCGPSTTSPSTTALTAGTTMPGTCVRWPTCQQRGRRA